MIYKGSKKRMMQLLFRSLSVMVICWGILVHYFHLHNVYALFGACIIYLIFVLKIIYNSLIEIYIDDAVFVFRRLKQVSIYQLEGLYVNVLDDRDNVYRFEIIDQQGNRNRFNCSGMEINDFLAMIDHLKIATAM